MSKIISSIPLKGEDILSRECRFCIPLKGPGDWHLVKEKVVLKDNTVVNRINLLQDFKMPVYITKQKYQGYLQKREREHISRLDKFMVTRSDKEEVLARNLNKTFLLKNDNYQIRKQIYDSPYIYGSDYEHSSYLKYLYTKKYNTFTPFNIAVFDIETDMVHDTGRTNIATLSFKDKIITAVTKDFIKNISNAEEKLKAKFDYYLGEIKKKRNINWILKICDTPGECIQEVFKHAHMWSPDVIAIWNMNFDIPIIIKDLIEDGIDPAEVFSDPFIPKANRFYFYKEGALLKEKADGNKSPLKPAQRWHYFISPASFYITDAMCVYYRIRMAQQEEPSYALDYILDKELGIRKLKFTEADHIRSNTPMWHTFLQKEYPLEYIIYNVFDCISVELLDEKTYDISVAMQSRLKTTPFKNFSSETRRNWDKIYGFLLERGYIAGIAQGVQLPDDHLSIDRDDWIVTLPAHLMPLKKSRYYEETNCAYTKIRTHCADLDISAAYPSNGVALNISKETTVKELLSIKGVDITTRKHQGMNLSGGHTNAVEFMSKMFKAPTIFEMDDLYQNHLKSNQDQV